MNLWIYGFVSRFFFFLFLHLYYRIDWIGVARHLPKLSANRSTFPLDCNAHTHWIECPLSIMLMICSKRVESPWKSMLHTRNAKSQKKKNPPPANLKLDVIERLTSNTNVLIKGNWLGFDYNLMSKNYDLLLINVAYIRRMQCNASLFLSSISWNCAHYALVRAHMHLHCVQLYCAHKNFVGRFLAPLRKKKWLCL